MAYSNFKSFEDIKRLALDIKTEKNLFQQFDAVKPSSFLTSTLDYNTPLALAIATEKALSEFIIVPILLEIHRALKGEISLFSGVEFDVDEAKGLTGRCDLPRGKRREELELQAKGVFENLPILSANKEIAETYSQIKSGLKQKGRPLDKENDIWIAATAKFNNMCLVSGEKGFKEIDGLLVENWV